MIFRLVGCCAVRDFRRIDRRLEAAMEKEVAPPRPSPGVFCGRSDLRGLITHQTLYFMGVVCLTDAFPVCENRNSVVVTRVLRLLSGAQNAFVPERTPYPPYGEPTSQNGSGSRMERTPGASSPTPGARDTGRGSESGHASRHCGHSVGTGAEHSVRSGSGGGGASGTGGLILNPRVIT